VVQWHSQAAELLWDTKGQKATFRELLPHVTIQFHPGITLPPQPRRTCVLNRKSGGTIPQQLQLLELV
jgi:hypothetical protein